MAQHALVLGSSVHVQSDPSVPSQSAQSGHSTIQPDPTQESVKSELTCLAPRATVLKEQGFPEAVAARIEAPQRGSIRSVHEAKWPILTKWCLSSQVDFRAPPLKAIADFLLYLFQDSKLQPGTTVGCRSAIADKLGNSLINVSKHKNLTHLLDSFYRDRQKGRRGKTVLLLALSSGKCRSEIHACLHKNIRHQSDWSHPDFYPRTSWLRKAQIVWPQ